MKYLEKNLSFSVILIIIFTTSKLKTDAEKNVHCSEWESKLYIKDESKIDIYIDRHRHRLRLKTPIFSLFCGQRADINLADERTLIISGVKRKIANKILQYRENVGYIKSIDEIETIKGIGKKGINLMKEKFYVSEER